MPGQIDDEELDTGAADESEDTEEENEDGESSEESESEESSTDGDKSQKRIQDLQSRADKAEARANRLEKALKLAGKSGDGEANDPATEALMQELREASLDAVYGEYPDLKKFGIERSLIEGSTRAEMRESATSIVALVKAVATKVRNETLSEHGIKAEPAGATRKPPVDYRSMSDEDFEKLLDSTF